MSVVFKGTKFQVKKHDDWETVVHPGSVVILPLIDPHTVLMIKNRRPSVGEVLWELPAGTVEESELPLVTAKRELEEETGFKAKSLRPLLEFYSTPGYSNERIYVFVADELIASKQKLDQKEQIEVVPVKWTQALEMMRNQEISDAKTMLALLYYALY